MRSVAYPQGRQEVHPAMDPIKRALNLVAAGLITGLGLAFLYPLIGGPIMLQHRQQSQHLAEKAPHTAACRAAARTSRTDTAAACATGVADEKNSHGGN